MAHSMTAPASKVEAERDAQQPTYANRRLMNDWAEYLAAENH